MKSKISELAKKIHLAIDEYDAGSKSSAEKILSTIEQHKIFFKQFYSNDEVNNALNSKDILTNQNFLHLAVKKRCPPEIIEYLLLHKVNPYKYNNEGMLPIHCMFIKKDFDKIDQKNLALLVKYDSENIQKNLASYRTAKENAKPGSNLLRLAVNTQSSKAVKAVLEIEELKPLLYETDDFDGPHPIFNAILQGDLSIVESLVEADSEKRLFHYKTVDDKNIIEYTDALAKLYGKQWSKIKQMLGKAYENELNAVEALNCMEYGDDGGEEYKRKSHFFTSTPMLSQKKMKTTGENEKESNKLTIEQKEKFDRLLYRHMLELCKARWPSGDLPEKYLNVYNVRRQAAEGNRQNLSLVLIIPGEKFNDTQEAELFKNYLVKEYLDITHKKNILISKDNSIENTYCKLTKKRTETLVYLVPQGQYQDNTVVISLGAIKKIYFSLKQKIIEEIGAGSETVNNEEVQLLPSMQKTPKRGAEQIASDSSDIEQKFSQFLEKKRRLRKEGEDALIEEKEKLIKQEKELDEKIKRQEEGIKKTERAIKKIEKCVRLLENTEKINSDNKKLEDFIKGL